MVEPGPWAQGVWIENSKDRFCSLISDIFFKNNIKYWKGRDLLISEVTLVRVTPFNNFL